MSVATETNVFVVSMFDRVAKVLFGCSADEFFDFAKNHPFAVANAGKILEGKMLRITLSKAQNGNCQHLRVVSVCPLRSRFQPAIVTLREMYRFIAFEFCRVGSLQQSKSIPGETFNDVVGSPYYVAPEILWKLYGPESDVWSARVILCF